MSKLFVYIKRVFLLIGDDKKKLPLVFFMFLFSPLIEMLSLGIIFPFISIILDPNVLHENYLKSIFNYLGLRLSSNEIILLLSICLVITFTIKGVLSILNIWIIEDFNLKRQFKLQILLMKSFQNLNYLDHINRSSSDFSEIIQNLVGTYCAVLTAFLRILSELLIVIGVLIFLSYIDYKILVYILSMLLFIMIIYDMFFKKKLKIYGEKISKSSKNIFQIIKEGVFGFKEIKILDKNDFFLKNIYKNSKKIYKTNIKSLLINSAPRYIIEVFLIIFVISIIIFSILNETEIESLIPTLTVFGFAALRLIPSANVIMRSVIQMRLGYYATNKLSADFSNINYEFNPENIFFKNKDFEKKSNSLKKFELKNIHFRYPGSKKKILDDVSVIFKKGDKIGIMGASGSGKTTLIDVILGLLEPEEGKILINNKEIISQNSWKGIAAYMPQEIFLMEEKIITNITFEEDEKNIDLEKFKKSIMHAQLNSFINELPEKYNTFVGENGVKLSGGQKQRLSIARAFYHERDLLIMDESTSALDKATENEIVNVINQINDKIVILISHKLNTLKKCDKIYEIENGKLIEINYDK